MSSTQVPGTLWQPNAVWPAPGYQPAATLPPKVKKTYPVDKADVVLALAVVLLGYCWWHWIMPRSAATADYDSAGMFLPGLAVTLLFVMAVACSVVYFIVKKVRLTLGGIAGAALVVLGALPYAIYDTTPLHLIAGPVLVAGYITWHAYAAHTAVSPVLGGMTTADMVNQGLVVPTRNAGSWLAVWRSMTGKRKQAGQAAVALVGVLVGLPVIVCVVALLMSSDTRFKSWMTGLGRSFGGFNLWSFLWQFGLGLVVAMYLFALMYGNAHRLGVDTITPARVATWSASMHKVTVTAVVAPIAILCLAYVVFFAAMGSYVFSAFAGTLPPDFTYAQYARQGFFELTAVATINLAVIGFTYAFVRRHDGAYPVSLRVAGGTLAGLTLLLIATAVSKMVLYIGRSGLTQLRLYTLSFMVVMFVVFALLCVWHIRRFRVGTPVALVVLLAFLGLTWANTDGMIAGYDTQRYLDGRLTNIDVAYLANLSAAAVPSLVELESQAGDAAVRQEAANALADWASGDVAVNPLVRQPWTSWTWQSGRAVRLLEDR